MALTNSRKLYRQAQEVMVGGVNSPVRAFKSVGGEPLLMAKGHGAKFFDVDGNGYTDYCLSWGALVLGHAHRDVVSAVQKAAANGTSYGTTTRPEVEIARLITRHVPSIEQIRFVNSGTEATMSAIRLARGFTKRDVVIKFDGCYHGHVDDLLTTAGSGVVSLTASSSEGIPAAHVQNTISLPYNNVTLLEETIHRHKDRIACVIVEPVAGNMGVIKPFAIFLIKLRELTAKYGIVLIFDEVMTGFRTGLGCVQGDVGITPDLTCLGKIIGGGFPVGAYGGRRDIMQCLAPEGGVYQAGTFAGNPIVMQAGLATLKNLTPSFYKNLNTRATAFALAVNRDLEERSIPAHLSHYNGMMSLRFRKQHVHNYTEAQAASSRDIYAKLFQYLLKSGIYWPPADLEAFFVSSAHTARDYDQLRTKLVTFFSAQ